MKPGKKRVKRGPMFGSFGPHGQLPRGVGGSNRVGAGKLSKNAILVNSGEDTFFSRSCKKNETKGALVS